MLYNNGRGVALLRRIEHMYIFGRTQNHNSGTQKLDYDLFDCHCLWNMASMN
jgi:hypothetical protein